MTQELPFWQAKKLQEMTQAEWELLCDGCGKCCYRKFIEKHKRTSRVYYTRIACNLLDLKTGLCSNYPDRFKLISDCTKLTKKNINQFYWLPDTCAYRLIHEGKSLYEWHPLISGDSKSVKKSGIQIAKGVHEKDVIDWFEFVIKEE